ncbi:MAG: SpoIVB peptidase [Defluviitaleaceae bacterium]|nr:SpoIVB peptidase [Defluviitaleaceae bacterium]
MKTFVKFLRSNTWTILSINILCALTALFITGFDRFPDGITISAGSVKQIGVNMPVRATFSPSDDADVGVPALKVDNKPLTDNIDIDLSDSVTLTAGESGSAMLSLNMFGLPGRSLSLDVLPEYTLIPWGKTVGVRVETDGVMVLGTGDIIEGDGKTPSPSAGVLRSGDMITIANGQQLANKSQFMDIIKNSHDDLSLRVRRREQYFDATIKPHVNSKTSERTIGVWIRDDTKGIGTVTYYNPRTNRFAALGHGIVDIDTKQMMSIRSGRIMETEVVSVVKGKKGAPGELVGKVRESRVLGNVDRNSPYGIFGSLNLGENSAASDSKVSISPQSQVYVGPAVIRSTVDRSDIKEFDIFIESVNKFSGDDTRGMVIRITDPELIRRTNGIVQGMSGSPILQDGKLVGAVTHVFVQEPTRGYAIFIENMLKNDMG